MDASTKTHEALKPFRDLDNFDQEYAEGADVSHLPADRLTKLVNRGIVKDLSADKKAEADAKKAEADAKKLADEQKKQEADAKKKAEADAKEAAKKAEAEAKEAAKKAEADAKKAEGDKQKAESDPANNAPEA